MASFDKETRLSESFYNKSAFSRFMLGFPIFRLQIQATTVDILSKISKPKKSKPASFSLYPSNISQEYLAEYHKFDQSKCKLFLSLLRPLADEKTLVIIDS